jgi:uncharacterized protein DUF4252
MLQVVNDSRSSRNLRSSCQDLYASSEYRVSRHLSFFSLSCLGRRKIMSRSLSFLLGRVSRCAAFSAVVYFGVIAAYTHAFAAEAEREITAGRIDFNEAKLPAATVEVDLSAGMFGDLVGLGEAAIAGVGETLRQSAGLGRGSEGTQIASEQLAAAQQLVQLAHGVIHEVRVRVYEDVKESVDADSLMAQFDNQLQQGNWENVVKIRDGKDNVRVSLLRKSGAIQGAFVVVADGNDLVLANVVGNVSPENVKKITSAAAKIGLENGLQQVLDAKMQKLRHRLPAPPATPTPPTPLGAPEPAAPK